MTRRGRSPRSTPGLRARTHFGLWIALVGTALFAVGDAIFAADVLWLLYPLKAFYLLTLALAFRALPRRAAMRTRSLASRWRVVAVSFLVSAAWRSSVAIR